MFYRYRRCLSREEMTKCLLEKKELKEIIERGMLEAKETNGLYAILYGSN